MCSLDRKSNNIGVGLKADFFTSVRQSSQKSGSVRKFLKVLTMGERRKKKRDEGHLRKSL